MASTSASGPLTYSYPAFQLRYPLGPAKKAFPKGQSSAERPRSSPSARPECTSPTKFKTRIRETLKRGAVEDEYIKNLQQQIYLLELETRYLRSGKEESPSKLDDNDDSRLQRANTAPLNETLKSLKSKYVDLQEGHKREIQKLKRDLSTLQATNESTSLQNKQLRIQASNLERQLAAIRDEHSTEKDKLYNEISALKLQVENIRAESGAFEKSYQRVADEKAALEQDVGSVRTELGQARGQVEEQVQINERLKKKVDELSRENSILKLQIETAPTRTAHTATSDETHSQLRTQLSHTRTLLTQAQSTNEKLESDISELVKSNVVLQIQVETLTDELKTEKNRRGEKLEWVKDAQRQKDETEGLRDEVAMLKVKLEVGERRMGELADKLKTATQSINTTTEQNTHLNTRLLHLNDHIQKLTTQLSALSSDKSTLIDDLAQARNSLSLQTHRINLLTTENQRLQVEVGVARREKAECAELERLLREVEWCGESYLGGVRGVREFLRAHGVGKEEDRQACVEEVKKGGETPDVAPV